MSYSRIDEIDSDSKKFAKLDSILISSYRHDNSTPAVEEDHTDDNIFDSSNIDE
jgi:hypothetical protein